MQESSCEFYAWNLTEKVRGFSWKYSSANCTVTVQAALATSPSDTCTYSLCAALIINGVVSCYQRKHPWKYSKGNSCYWRVTNDLTLISSFFLPCSWINYRVPLLGNIGDLTLWRIVVDISTTHLNINYRFFRTPNDALYHFFFLLYLSAGPCNDW